VELGPQAIAGQVERGQRLPGAAGLEDRLGVVGRAAQHQPESLGAQCHHRQAGSRRRRGAGDRHRAGIGRRPAGRLDGEIGVVDLDQPRRAGLAGGAGALGGAGQAPALGVEADHHLAGRAGQVRRRAVAAESQLAVQAGRQLVGRAHGDLAQEGQRDLRVVGGPEDDLRALVVDPALVHAEGLEPAAVVAGGLEAGGLEPLHDDIRGAVEAGRADVASLHGVGGQLLGEGEPGPRVRVLDPG
jgi:hypothetical protein